MSLLVYWDTNTEAKWLFYCVKRAKREIPCVWTQQANYRILIRKVDLIQL